mmetsp:Transcript_14870/g.39817  ORF Transcript_14870/g.39817 Transcript_14870/m.39817 type:complete len:119 (+) Transcript_14870:104-460(+)
MGNYCCGESEFEGAGEGHRLGSAQKQQATGSPGAAQPQRASGAVRRGGNVAAGGREDADHSSDDPEARREKMLAAAEARQKQYENRGVQNAAGKKPQSRGVEQRGVSGGPVDMSDWTS